MYALVKLPVVILAVVFGCCGSASARDRIKIVGSSTVFPFSTAVAEAFGKSTGYTTPEIESTGSGGGLKLFCRGVGTDTPDIANASRRMKVKEFKLCIENGVTDIIESVLGFNGVVVANAKDAPQFNLTREILFKALVKGQGEPATWNEIDPSLPATKIEVIGPPPSSGTRDTFEELALEKGCSAAGMGDDICDNIEVRDDGAYVSAENEDLIFSKLQSNPNAVGVFSFSFLDQHADKLKGATVGGVAPTFDNIASGDYPVSRSMFMYIKKAHVGVVPGVMEYAAEFVSEDASGDGGYLSEKGLIPLPAHAHSENQIRVVKLVALDGTAWVGDSETKFANTNLDVWDVKATRLFAGPHNVPPEGFAAYGIVAFPHGRTQSSHGRFELICNAFLSRLVASRDSSRPAAEQMVTVWPVKTESIAQRINDPSNENRCGIAARMYGSNTARVQLNNAENAGHHLSGAGPFLLAWSPSNAVGDNDALVLAVDLGDVETEAQAIEVFDFWAKEIEEQGFLWRNGWSMELIRLNIKFNVDSVGRIIFGDVE